MERILYQLVLLGDAGSSLARRVVSSFEEQCKAFHGKEPLYKILELSSFYEIKWNAPICCIYFGYSSTHEERMRDEVMLSKLIEQASYIIPVVSLKAQAAFDSELPQCLCNFNAISSKGEKACVSTIVGKALESFHLLRSERKVFISYKRTDSQKVALQLFETLSSYGYRVFFDTHSIQVGEKFQDELWHQMVDCDVVVLLNSPNFMGSQWTRKEFAKANEMSIALLQIVWPEVKPLKEGMLSQIIDLKGDDKKARLLKAEVNRILLGVESLRARGIAARTANLNKEFIESVKEGEGCVVQLEHNLLKLTNNKEEESLIVSAIGVPQSPLISYCKDVMGEYHLQSIKFVYDGLCIRKRWLGYLSWLNEYLPIKSIDVRLVNKEEENG